MPPPLKQKGLPSALRTSTVKYSLRQNEIRTENAKKHNQPFLSKSLKLVEQTVIIRTVEEFIKMGGGRRKLVNWTAQTSAITSAHRFHYDCLSAPSFYASVPRRFRSWLNMSTLHVQLECCLHTDLQIFNNNIDKTNDFYYIFLVKQPM